MTIRGPRGDMRRIPEDAERRTVALVAVDKLINGFCGNRADLFRERDSHCWQKNLLRRMRQEGAVRAEGVTAHRTLFTGNLKRLRAFKALIQETDALTRSRGYGRRFSIPKDLLAILDGLMLGDGHYTKPISGGLSVSLNVSQVARRIDWLRSLQDSLSTYGIESTVSKRPTYQSVRPNGTILRASESALLRTRTYWTLKEQRLRWYPQGKKLIPSDLDISSPITLAQWYMGDGCASVPSSTISLSTCCFSEQEVRWLCDQLHLKHGVRAVFFWANEYPNICISSRHAEKFLAIVRPYVVPCFKYKIPCVWLPSTCVLCSKPIENRKRTAKYCDNCCPKRLQPYRAFA